MKTITKLLLIMVTVVAMISFSGCSKVNELFGDEGDPWTTIQNGWTDNGNTCTYKTSLSSITKGDIYDVYWLLTFTFDDNNAFCTSAKWEYACPNATIAQLVEMDLPDVASVNGRIIVIDITGEFNKMDKKYIKDHVAQWCDANGF